MKFHVVGVDPGRNIVALDMHAATAAIALDTARKQGLTVLSVRSRAVALPRPRGEPAFPLTLFSIELMSLLDAGLNLVEALQTLSEREFHGERQAVLAGVLEAIYRGESFSQAVGRFPRHFPPLYVATLRASERTGNIRESLSRYIAYQEEIDRVRKKIVSASIYPAILIVVGSLVLAFLMFYVVPRFARVYEGISGELPFFSQMLLAAGRGIEQHGWLLAVFIAAAAAFGAYGLSRPVFRAWLYARVWRIPAIGERMKVYQLARLYRTVGMLLRAGIPVVPALDMVRDLLDAHLRAQLAHARILIGEGQSISRAFTATGLATPVAARMMAVGERGGEMGDMMERIARFHDDEIARFVDWFTRAFEPVLMAVLGLAIGLVVVLMYMPIFELAGSIQ
ncbi:MAG TPA: type II secretion system F family protein [Burkholderiales bacterium]|jgi:general secretion pathway protein F|nr:type II secretion system F family protein [Burkholderiales bacterium]